MVAPKDKDPQNDICGTVYHLSCADCNQDYIGETERKLGKRIKEHHKDKSVMGAHLLSHRHSLDSDNVKILDRDSRWFERGVREAIHIRS